MRIGFAISALHGGGAEYVLRTWVRSLLDEGHDVVVFTYDPAEDGSRTPTGAQHFHFHHRGTRVGRLTALSVWLAATAARERLDVMVSMLTFTNLASIAGWRVTGCRVPLLISERNVPTSFLPIMGRSGLLQRSIARRFYRLADGAVAISHPVAGDLLGGYGLAPDRIFVVPNPVFSKVAPARVSPEKAVRVGFVGRLVTQKQPDVFVQALSALASRGLTVTGVIVGEGPLRETLAAAGERANVKLEFMGWLEPWTDASDQMDCLLLPSSVEGFGNVLVEATGAGVPVVAASSALGVADAIVPGMTGELALTTDPEELADAIMRAVTNDPTDPLAAWMGRFSVATSVAALLGAIAHTTETPGARRG